MATVDITVLQEVMKEVMVADSSGAPPCSVLPGSVGWVSMGPYGKNAYKEYYLTLYRTTPRVGGPTVAYANHAMQATPPDDYMRPPVALLFNITPDGSSIVKQVLIGNFHAVWGKTVSGRRAEVENVARFYTNLKTATFGNTPPPDAGHNIIIGGDWNMSASDPGFDHLKVAGAVIEPNLLSSLTRAGALSQPYDHFVHTPSVTLANAQVYPATEWVAWRNHVSDHLGITAEVTLP
ncbi:hypothetical protein ACVBEF_06725 [Glaciimonas sp. GG7]